MNYDNSEIIVLNTLEEVFFINLCMRLVGVINYCGCCGLKSQSAKYLL